MSPSEEHTGEKLYDEIANWHLNWPFRGEEPTPRVLHEDDAYFLSWASSEDGLNRTPCWFYTSTPRLTTGIFTLGPGDYFKPDSHPNPEPYLILEGTIHLSNPDTGQLVELSAGDAAVIPAFQFHTGYNFGTEPVRILWMIPRSTLTDEVLANPVYDDHYSNWRDPIVLHREPRHRTVEYDRWAQPNFRVDSPPKSRHVDLRRWPPAAPPSAVSNPDVDTGHLYHRGQWLHFVTGGDPRHQFLTSFIYSTSEFQFGTVRVPANRITTGIEIDGERVYYPLDGKVPFIVNLIDSGQSLAGTRGDAIFIPAGVAHQLQNLGHESVEVAFACGTAPGVSLYD